MTSTWTGGSIDCDVDIDISVDVIGIGFGPLSASRADITIHGFDIAWNLSRGVVERIDVPHDVTVEQSYTLTFPVDVSEDDFRCLPESDEQLTTWAEESFESHVQAEYGRNVDADFDVMLEWRRIE